MIVPTLRVGTPLETLCVSSVSASGAERHWLHSHAEHGNDHDQGPCDARPFFCLKFDEATAPNQGIQPNVRTDYSLENGYFALLAQ